MAQYEVTLVRRSVGPTGVGTKAEDAKPAPWGELTRGKTSIARSATNLIFAAAILEKKTGEREALAAQAPLESGQAASRSESASCDSSGVTAGPRGGSAARSAFQPSENPQQSVSFSTVEENESPFIPVLSADVSAVASSGEVLLRPSPEGLGPAGAAYGSPSSRLPLPLVFRSLGSKTDPVLHVRFPRPWSVVAENREISKWRGLLNLVRTAILGDE